MPFTFQVGNEPIPQRFIERRPQMAHWLADKNVRQKMQGSQTLHANQVQTVGGTTPLFHAMSYAFNNHCPLVLTPDSVWLTILTGLTHHIDTDPEGLRHHFVQHEGKKTLTVKVWSPDIFSAPPEVWEDAIKGGSSLIAEPGNAPFAEQLQEALNPKRYDLIVNNFSTTTDTDRLASQIALMGAMKNYFSYKMMLCCGFTRVTIEGTPEDWGNLIDRVRALSEFGLGFWTDQMLPVLDQIRLACEGKPDIDFWRRAYLKQGYGSGGDYNVTGWINTLYPYIHGNGGFIRNPCINWQEHALQSYGSWDNKPEGHKGYKEGVHPDDFPFGLISAPVLVDDHGTPYNCEFYGGLVGVSMANDFTVKPESGYAMQFLGRAE